MIKQRYFEYKNLIYILYFIFCISCSIFYFIKRDYKAAVYSLIIILSLFIPSIIYKIFKFTPIDSFSVSIIVYIFLAYNLGIIIDLYKTSVWYDKFVHFLAGYYFSIIGLGIFYFLKTNKTISYIADKNLATCFCLTFSMTIAVVWEFMEYSSFLLTDKDPQNHLTTGVHDTMHDLLICMLGSIIALFFIYNFYKTKKTKGPLIKTFYNFYTLNIQNKNKKIL